MPLLRRAFLLSRDFDLSIRAACILARFVVAVSEPLDNYLTGLERALTCFKLVCLVGSSYHLYFIAIE